tara:strand:- start:222 stop:593 length:372 start_codon:yes stop_codon:yes gene_type:complete
MIIGTGKYQAKKKKNIDKLKQKLDESNNELFEIIKINDKVKPKNLFNAIDLYQNDSLLDLVDKKERFKNNLVILESYLQQNINTEKNIKEINKQLIKEIKIIKKKIKQLDNDIEKIKSYFSFE